VQTVSSQAKTSWRTVADHHRHRDLVEQGRIGGQQNRDDAVQNGRKEDRNGRLFIAGLNNIALLV
jgi:hypothetical protein